MTQPPRYYMSFVLCIVSVYMVLVCIVYGCALGTVAADSGKEFPQRGQ